MRKRRAGEQRGKRERWCGREEGRGIRIEGEKEGGKNGGKEEGRDGQREREIKPRERAEEDKFIGTVGNQ